MRFYDTTEEIESTDRNHRVKLAPVPEENRIFFLVQGPAATDLEIICYVHNEIDLAAEIYTLARHSITFEGSVTRRTLFASIRSICAAVEKIRNYSA